MAVFYETIINQSVGTQTRVENMKSPCQPTNSPTYTHTALAVIPSSESRSYEPFSALHERLVNPSDRSQKWSQIKRSGLIKMTPYYNRKIVEHNYLASVSRNSYDVKCNGTARCCSGNWTKYGPWLLDVQSTYDEQGDLYYWKQKYPLIPHYRATIGADSSEIESAKTEAWNEMLNGYDLSTELAELRKTVGLISGVLTAVRSPLQSFITAKAALKNPKDIAKLWLTYRYGIMPLVYSVKDILRLSKTKGLYYSARRTIYGSISDPVLPSSGSYFYESVTGASKTSVIAKAHWSSSALQSVDRISINPFTTAWELIPYSFVIDWFANIGDFVSAYVRSYTTAADQSIGCISNRQNYQLDTFLRLEIDEERIFDFPRRLAGPCGSTPAGFVEFDGFTYTRGSKRTVNIHLQREVVDEYTRVLFNNQDLKLAFSPYLDWKRLLDALALSLNPLSQALRKLRK